MPSSFADPDVTARTPNKWQICHLFLAGLILLFGVRCYSTFRVFNDTADEAVHIDCGLEVIEHRRYTMEAQHPPLARALLAIPAHLAGLRYRHPVVELWSGRLREFYWRTLSAARLGNLFWAPLLFLHIFRWGRELHGPIAGLGAAALASFCPNLLAHASLATLDFGAAATVVIAAYHFWRWGRDPGVANCLFAAAAFAAAVLVKFSALVILPLVAAFLFLSGRPSVRQGLWFVVTSAALIWGGYLFDIGTLGEPHFHPPEGTFAATLERETQRLAAGRSLPAPQFWRGLLDVAGHNAEGHDSYLLGRLGKHGWWYYFPVALALKTTLPLLALAGMWLAARCLWRSWSREELYPLVAAAVVLALAMTSHINLGVRHILAVYPFLALLVSGLFAGAGVPAIGRRMVVALAFALGLWQAGESLAAHPDYLAYFNETARGREDDFLLDSNLDWGQDLERLRRYLENNGITEIHLSYFGRSDPSELGIRGVRRLQPGERPAGWLAVSKNHIHGLGLASGDFLWLKAYQPRAQIGKSILVYYFPST